MDHKLAEETGTVERYLLNELPPDQRLAFEEHLFDCPICGDLVRSGAISIDNLKEVFRDEPDKAIAAEAREAKRWNWTAWFRLPNLVPSLAAAALAVVLCYQNFVYIPSLERPEVLTDNVIAPVTRSEAPVITVNRAHPLFNLNFAVDSPRVYPLYTCEFQLEGQRTVLKMDSGPRQFASFTLNLLLPAKLFPAGHYVMIVRPKTEPETEIQRYEFTIQ
ncbi:MAG TPA: zf-HC2 domain-containing protein [Bryobacteraceae bacterium]|jgi:hypothetical protein